MRQSIILGGVVTVISVVGGCGILFPVAPESGSADLQRFTSQQELSTYFQDQILARNQTFLGGDRADGEDLVPGDPPTADGPADVDSGTTGGQPPAAGDGEGFSGTTIQEQDVDEADVVKTDGTYFYLLDTRYDGSTVLRVVRGTPLDAMVVVSETPLAGYGRDLYLVGGTVVAMTSGGGIYFAIGGASDGGIPVSEPRPDDSGGAGELPADGGGEDGKAPDIITDAPIGGFTYERPFTIVSIINVADPADPVVSSTTKFDGTPASSRMIAGNLHLVLANDQGNYYDALPLLGRPELQVADIDAAELLPGYEQTTAAGTPQQGDLVTWENLYRPTDPDGFGVVTVVSMNTADPQASFSAVGIVAEPGLVYSSSTALYLTDTNYDLQGDARSTTDIYKLAYDGASATPAATGSVPGRILNQYSMGEHEGRLRVATTIDPLFFFEGDAVGAPAEPVNAIYVLEEADGALTIMGRAEGIAVGETIQSARFAGSRCFLVTFRQIDPLFTIDLSDPADPQVVGELHVPGFSTYLTPMGPNHVLAVGQFVPPPGEFGDWGVQLSIFDVSDFANPQRTANVVVGGDSGGSYSEALWNPKALTYYPEQNAVALPVSIYGRVFVEDRPSGFDGGVVVDVGTGVSTGSGQADAPPPTEPADDVPDDLIDAGGSAADYFEGLLVFSATPEEGLIELGRISTQFGDAGFYYPSFTRGVFIGAQVYAVTNIGLRAASLSDVSNVQGQLFYGPDDAFGPPGRPQPGDPVTLPELVDPG